MVTFLTPGPRLLAVEVFQPIDQQKGIAMRQQLHDARNVGSPEDPRLLIVWHAAEFPECPTNGIRRPTSLCAEACAPV